MAEKLRIAVAGAGLFGREHIRTLAGIDDPSRMADTVAAHLNVRLADKQRALEIVDVGERLELQRDVGGGDLAGERELRGAGLELALGVLEGQPDLTRHLGHRHRGQLGEQITKAIQEAGGWLTMEDLADIQLRWLEPLAIQYRGDTIMTMPPECWPRWRGILSTAL